MENIITPEQQQFIALFAAISQFTHGIVQALAPHRKFEFYSNDKTEIHFKDMSEKEHVYSITRQEGL